MEFYFLHTTPTPTPRVSYNSDCIVLTRAYFVVQKAGYSVASLTASSSPDWNSVVLADEAVFVIARFVVPGETDIFPQIDACLISTIIVRLILVPLCVAHSLGASICLFPYKPRLVVGVFPLSCRPYVDSVRKISIASRPLVICKHLISTLLGPYN